MPVISVLMPVYNTGDYVREAINSILSQTFIDFELIIINDGSTDHSVEVIKSINDRRLVFIDHKENAGNYPRRNEGACIASGKYIAVMDSDDIAMPERLERQLAVMEADTTLLACGTNYTFIGGVEGVLRTCLYEDIKVALRTCNCFLHTSLMIRREAFIKAGGYNESYRYSSDYDLMRRLALEGKIINLPDRLLLYRVHSGQISMKFFKEQDEFANRIRSKYDHV
ncbi:Hyaluronan synthase [termite gut metagenome]|uniref:Hyaluronan synthase n=1 Tax=termite gut metagenome TaxID=433724 RepID=A0A5J4SRC4_9ZZZZ